MYVSYRTYAREYRPYHNQYDLRTTTIIIQLNMQNQQ